MLPDAEDFNQKIIELTDADADGRITETGRVEKNMKDCLNNENLFQFVCTFNK